MYLCEFGQNPSTGSVDNTCKPYFGHFKASPSLFPNNVFMQVWSKPSNSSEDSAREPYFGHFKVPLRP